MKEKIKILTITTDRRGVDKIQLVHDKYVPETYQCFKARNEKEAIKNMHEANPEIVVIELLNSRLNGLDLLEKIKHINPQVKVFVYSYEDDQDTIDEFKERGAYKYYLIPLLIDTYFHDLYVSLNLDTE